MFYNPEHYYPIHSNLIYLHQMIFQAHKPVFPLNYFVENLIYFDELDIPHNLDRFLPDGNTEIIIDLTEHPQYIYDNETLQEIQICRYAWVSGVRTQPITIPSGRGSRMLIVAFKKGKAFPFYRFPISELTDTSPRQFWFSEAVSMI